MNYLALVVELHHPLPGPGQAVGPDWVASAVGLYWPLIRAGSGLAERHAESVLTLAVSPSWTALAADPAQQARVRAELERRAEWSDAGRKLARFVIERWNSDGIAALRQAQDAGALELIATTASPTWLPSLATDPLLARAQVMPAVADHRQRFGSRPKGIWLPFLSYLPGLETVLADAGLLYFGVPSDAFLRGTVLPPERELEPMVTPPGVAAFGVSPAPTLRVTDPAGRYARDPRYANEAQASAAVADHAAHFVSSWRDDASSVPHSPPPGKISVAALSAHDLGGSWPHGPAWLDETLRRMTWASDWRPTTPGRFLDRHPQGTLGRPGPTAGGLFSVRPGGTDLLDRCRSAGETLAELLEHRDSLDPIGRRALAQMTRSLLRAQAVDWHLPVGQPIGADAGLRRAERHLARFHELAGLLSAGRLDPTRLAEHEAGPAYLPDIDLALLTRT